MIYEGYYRGLRRGAKLFKNGDLIPILGFGTGTGYFERPDAVAEGIVLAFNAGYRLIDTAQVNLIHQYPDYNTCVTPIIRSVIPLNLVVVKTFTLT
jgi:hypothetical protein